MNIQDSHKIKLIMKLRQAGINDITVLSALERTPREIFIPENFIDQAYEDTALPIGMGQTISQPYIVALMTQSLEINDRDKVLEIGTGSGYQGSILARLCRRLYTIERHKPLLEVAEHKFAEQGLRNITAMVGDGMKGWPQQAPFDKIIVTAGALEKPPQDLLDQLKIGGLMVIPVGNRMHNQILKLYRKESDDLFSVKDLCPVRFVPLLPDIAKTKEYTDDDYAQLPD